MYLFVLVIFSTQGHSGVMRFVFLFFILLTLIIHPISVTMHRHKVAQSQCDRGSKCRPCFHFHKNGFNSNTPTAETMHGIPSGWGPCHQPLSSVASLGGLQQSPNTQNPETHSELPTDREIIARKKPQGQTTRTCKLQVLYTWYHSHGGWQCHRIHCRTAFLCNMRVPVTSATQF